MKLTKKVIAVILVVLMVVTSVCTAAVTVSAAEGSLASCYQTNPGGKAGKQATITIDGNGSDWSEDMIIAKSAAWDCANHWKGSHENCLIDAYALLAAWDNDNLYIGMQYVNTTDTWQKDGEASLMDGGKMGDLHLVLALSVNPSSQGLTGKVTDGRYIWGDQIDYKTHVDHLFYMSTKAGEGNPGHFTVSDAKGNSDYDAHCGNFKKEGIEYKLFDGNVCSAITGLNDSKKPEDVCSDSSNWVDYKTFKGSKGVHNTKYDSFYEMKIPLKVLGITASQISSTGIGAMTLCGRGESALDCCPFDLAMLDNVNGNYAKDTSTSHEKDDVDEITVPLARIGKSSGGGTPIPTEAPTTEAPTEAPTTTAAPTTEEPTTTAPIQTKEMICGDVNDDGIVTIKDATVIQKHIAKLTEITGDFLKAADVNGDGVVTIKDASAIQKYIAKLDGAYNAGNKFTIVV